MTGFHFVMTLPAERPARDFHATTPEVTRAKIADMIAALVDMLDDIDGEAACEEDDPAEPSLGWSTTMALGSADDLDKDAATLEKGASFGPRR